MLAGPPEQTGEGKMLLKTKCRVIGSEVTFQGKVFHFPNWIPSTVLGREHSAVSWRELWNDSDPGEEHLLQQLIQRDTEHTSPSQLEQGQRYSETVCSISCYAAKEGYTENIYTGQNSIMTFFSPIQFSLLLKNFNL